MNEIPTEYARLNITYRGQQGELPDPVLYSANETEIRQWATEALRSGNVPGIGSIDADNAINLNDFVVERFHAREDIPYNRISLRPKTAFGR